MKIALHYKRENKEIIDIVNNEAKKYGLFFDEKNPDVVISIGGDGTFLRAIHTYINQLDKILFVGINNGTLGFFYDFAKDEIPSLIKMIAEKGYQIKEHHLIRGDIKCANKEETIFAVNEIRIENPFHTLISEVYINDEKLETFRGSGLLVSSTLGSSAYNKSLGGALMDNDINALQLTEIAPISNNVYRSLGSSFVLSNKKTITFSGDFKHVVVGYDYLNLEEKELVSIKISQADKVVRVLHNENHSDIQRIRKSFILWFIPIWKMILMRF